MTTAQDFLTVAEAAEALGVSVTHVKWYCRRGHLPGARKAGARVWVIPREALDWLRSSRLWELRERRNLPDGD